MKLTILLLFINLTFLSFTQINMGNLGTITTGCGQNFYDSGGAGGNYGSSQNYTASFCAPAGQYITFTFTQFALGSGDNMAIYNGPNTGSPLIGNYPATSPGQVSSTLGGCLTFVFTSNAPFLFITSNGAGWTAAITCATTIPPPPPPPPGSCGGAQPFCTSTGVNYPAAVGTTSESGPNYGCLSTQPSPGWFYLNIATAGNIQINLSNSAVQDIDFAIWGPFATQAAMCAGTTAAPLDCSYSTSATEQVDIPNALVGQWYIMVITNYANAPTNITATAGDAAGVDGTTNCNILCNMTGLTVTPGACVSPANTYTVTGQISVAYPPTSGTLTVTSSCGGTVNVPTPWTSPIAYTLPGLTANGAACSITATFSADPTCSLTTPYTAPAACTSTCAITSVSASPSACLVGNTYNVNGSVAFTSPPASGTMTVSSSCGATQTFNSPFTSPIAYSLNALTANGAACVVTASFSATACSLTQNFTSPAIPTVGAGIDQIVCAGSPLTLTGTGATTYSWTGGITNGTAFTPGSSGSYTVTGTNATGCTNTDIVAVTVNPLATVNVNIDQTVCAGGTITLAGTIGGAATSSNWSAGSGAFSMASSLTSTYTPSITSGTINLTLTTNDPTGPCLAVTDIMVVTVNPLPTVGAGVDQTVCPGTSVTLSGSGASTYTWNNGVTNGVSFTPAGTLTYTVTGTSAGGCINTDQVVVTVNPLPTVGAGVDQTICIGASVTLTGSGASTYTWNNGVTNGVAFAPAATTTYTVTGTSAAGCINTDQVVVTVNPLPVVVANNISVCTGGTIALTATGASTYTWSPGTYLSATTGASVNFTAGLTTTYTVTGTSAAGCIGTDPITVTVLANAPINAGLDVAVCAGASTTLTATGGVTYTWNNGLGIGNNFSVTPAVTTTYTVVGTDAIGCTGTDAMTVTVSPLPIVNAGLDQTVCAVVAVTLTATGASTYTWTGGVTNGVAFVPAATATYTVTGTTAAGCTATDAVIVTVNPIPIVNAGPDQTVCIGTAVTLNGSGATTYTWTGGITNGVAFTAAATATYTVTGTTAAGCTATDAVLVTVNPLPIVNAGPDLTVCPGTAVTLTGSGASTYTWTGGVTNDVAFTPAATATYTVTGTSAAGCIATDAVIVTVSPLPFVNAGLDQTICIGASVTLTGSGASTYTWTGGVTNGVAFAPAATATYTVTGTSVAGCINTDQVIVTVNPLPVVVANNISVCTGGTIALTASGASTYTWSPGTYLSATTGASVNFTAGLTTTYTVTGTSAAGCISTDPITVTVLANAPINAGIDVAICAGASTTLTATGGVTYTWNNGLGIGNNFSVTPAVTTTYTVVGTDAIGCTGTDAMTVTVNPLPIVNAGLDQTVCAGVAVTLTATGASTYTWTGGVTNGVAFVPAATATYTVTGTTAAGCTATDAVIITVNPMPTTNAGVDQTVCAGTAVSLTGTGASTYTWTGGITNGVAFTPAATATYTVTGTTAAGCTTTDQVIVTVNPLPTTNAGVDQTLCAGPSVTLTATGASTYTWTGGVTNGIAFAPTVGTTTYTVTGTTAAGCSTTDQVIVTVNTNPVPIINGPNQYCSGYSATLSTNVPFTTYLWSNGATTPTINATIANNPITVTVTNGFGCSAITPVFTVIENAVITANFTAEICQGQSILIHGVSQTTAGVYSQTYTTVSGCDSVANVMLTVHALPLVNAGVNQAVCTTVPTVLTATGASTYTWSGGITNGIPFTQAIGSITYTATGTDIYGCINTDQVVVLVNPLPLIGAGPDQAICIGASATISGSGGVTYTWNNGVVNGTAFSPSLTNTYTVTGTDVNGCINTDQVVVTVNPLPPVNAGPDQVTCIGGSITLSGSGASLYTWNNGITNAVVFSPSATTTYTVTGTDVNGCINTDQVLVMVNSLPSVNAGPDQTVCVGTIVTLSGSGASTYTWNNAITNGVSFTPTVGSITYTVTGTSGANCIATDQVVVNVNPLPLVSAGPDQAICIGASATISGSGASTYTWNNGVTNGVAFSPSITNTYTVTGTNLNGCINTDQVVVTVNSLPLVNAGLDQIICIGVTPVILSGSGASLYAWNNGVTNGVAFTPTSTMTYTVTGTDVNGCINTDQVVVTVNNSPVVNAGPDQTVCIGTSVTISGSGASTYTWNNGVSNGVSFIPAVGTLTYTVTGTSGPGCISTDQLVVTVNPLPLVNAGPDQAICIGASVTLSGSGASTYTWNNGVTNNVPFSPVLTNTYTVTGTDLNGCIKTDDVIVTVNPLPIVGAGVDQTICVGASVSLSGSGASTYTWDNGVLNGVSFAPIATTTYTVTGTDVNGCIDSDQAIITVNPLPIVGAGIDQVICFGFPATLSGSGASTYTWSNGVTNGTPFTPAVGLITYTLTGTSIFGCLNTDQVDVLVNPLPVVGAGLDQAVCAGFPVTLSGSGAATYSWDNGITNGLSFVPIITTTYTVTGTSTAGCINTDQVLVTVNPLPTVFAGNDLTLCENQTATLTGSGASVYTWDNGISNGVTFTPAVGTTTYTVTGTTAFGCEDTDQMTILVNPLPAVSFMPGANLGCVPLTTSLTNTSPNSVNCVWTISNGDVLTGCGPLSTTFNQLGCYDITLTTTDINGCSNTFTAFDIVCTEAYPIAAFSPSESVMTTISTEVLFTNNSIGASSYSWDLGDNSPLTDVENPLHTYLEQEGTYIVTLIATTPLGCTDTAYATIQINEELLFYVPNTFTPDIDDYNPIFQPVFTSGFDPYDYTLLIFNRWGEVIFESHDASVGWDGTYGNNGQIEMVQDGTYTWKIEFKTKINDARKMIVGHVNVIR